MLTFERRNRAYFAEFITDRGDGFYTRFAEHLGALLAEQENGDCACYVLVDETQLVVGRFNLYELTRSTAVVGYRVAEHVAGRGVATAALRDLCRIARERHGLRTLRAAVSDRNRASQKVLERVGFLACGRAEVGGRSGALYELRLTGDAPRPRPPS